jgi:hypothetical protein
VAFSASLVAGYTGVLLPPPIARSGPTPSMLGLVFLVSDARPQPPLWPCSDVGGRRPAAGVHALERFDSVMLVLELIALIALVVSLGGHGARLARCVGRAAPDRCRGLGIIVPFVLYRRSLQTAGLSGAGAAAAVLVLLGGFLLRVVIILSSEHI